MRGPHVALAAAGAAIGGAIGIQGVSAQIAPGNTATCRPPSFLTSCSGALDSQEVDAGAAGNTLSMVDSFLQSQLVKAGFGNSLSITHSVFLPDVFPPIVNQLVVSGNGNSLTMSDDAIAQQVIDAGFANSLTMTGTFGGQQTVHGNGNTLVMTGSLGGSQLVTGNGNRLTGSGRITDVVTGNGNTVSDTDHGPCNVFVDILSNVIAAGASCTNLPNTTSVEGSGNRVTVTGAGDSVTLGTKGTPAHADTVNVLGNNDIVIVDGNGDSITVPATDVGDMITCMGNGITSLSSPDCSVEPTP